MRRLLTILPWIVGACASDPDHFDRTGWSNEQLAALDRAAEILCSQTNRCPALDGGASSIDAIEDITVLAPPDDEHVVAGACQHMSDGTSRIWIRANTEGDRLTSVALHEFGHHFGCSDSDDPTRVMYSGDGEAAGPTLTLTPADIECLR